MKIGWMKIGIKILRALSEVHPYAGMMKDAPVVIVAAYRKECMLPDYAQVDLLI